MKKLLVWRWLLALLFFYLSNSSAQSFDTVYVSIDSLSEQTLNFPSLWRYLPGDDSIKAFNSNPVNWDTLDVSKNLSNTEEKVWPGIGWFHKTIIIDSTLIDLPIALRVRHHGASEFYLNEKLIESFGKVGTFENEKIYQPHDIPVIIQFDTTLVNNFRIRYSNQLAGNDRAEYIKSLDNWGFNVGLTSARSGIIDAVQNGSMMNAALGILSGLFFSLCILYVLIFLFYQKKSENLFYALFTLFLSILMLRTIIWNATFSSFYTFKILNLIPSIGIIILFSLFVAFLYSIFYERMPKFIWLVIITDILFIALVLFTFMEDFLGVVFAVYIMLLTLEGLRVIIVAIRRKRRGALIIGSGVIIFVGFVLFIYGFALTGGGTLDGFGGLALVFSGLFAIPISMAIYLANDIAVTNKDLSVQLVTVKELSEKELENQKHTAELTLQAEKDKAESEKAKLQVQIVEAESARKSAELEEARQLQLSMLPKTLPDLPHLDIAVYMQTATEVGGDYYDFHVSMDGTLTTVIGDATGHGLNAGTIVTITKSLFNSYASSSSILDTFQEISQGIKEMKFKYLSMCLMILKIKGYELQLSAAGMPPALIYRKDKNLVDELLIKGMPLGAPASFPYEIINTSIQRGDTILLMSDGFPELLNKDKKMFGYDTARQKFEEAAGKEPEEIITYLKNTGADWMAGKDPDDDVTFVVIKVK